jgi:hypothetical protein
MRDITKAWVRASLLADLLPGISKCIEFDLDEDLDALYFFCVENDTSARRGYVLCLFGDCGDDYREELRNRIVTRMRTRSNDIGYFAFNLIALDPV